MNAARSSLLGCTHVPGGPDANSGQGDDAVADGSPSFGAGAFGESNTFLGVAIRLNASRASLLPQHFGSALAYMRNGFAHSPMEASLASLTLAQQRALSANALRAPVSFYPNEMASNVPMPTYGTSVSPGLCPVRFQAWLP